MIKIALIGNPNSGKTTLFNNLTGSTAYVGNWPGVTVEKKVGEYKKLDEPVQIVDLPGIYSLSPYTAEEVISRNFILNDKPDCVINIIDSTNLERNLYLTTQLLEIDVPVVVALNMMDIVKKGGNHIDAELLEKQLGVPVVEISALKETNLKNLVVVAARSGKTKRKGHTFIESKEINGIIGNVSSEMEKENVDNHLFHAIKLCEMDEIETKSHPKLVPMVTKFKETFVSKIFENDLEAIIADLRYKYISKYLSKAFIKNINNKNENEMKSGLTIKETKSDKIDKVLTNRWAGLPIFLVIIFLMFHFTFSEDLFYLNATGALNIISFEGTAFEGLFANGGINSIGIFLFNLMDIFTTWIIDLTNAGMTGAGASEWAVGLVCDGCISGLAAVLSFLPQILVLFFFFSILEDSGYMARVAFILDRIFRKFGLSGRAFIPMIMGFGCSIPAMINTRTLSSEKEKVATIRVIPYFSCGAKLPIITAVAGSIIYTFGIGNVDAITFSMYILGIAVAIISVLTMYHTTMRGDVAPFVMELPSYHIPQLKSLSIHVWDKCKHFMKKAFTVILASTIVIWFLMHFSFDWTYLEDMAMSESILSGLGKLFAPLFTPLGFGSQLNHAYSWVFVVAAVTGLIAKEAVISTFGVLAASIGAAIPALLVEGSGDVAAMIAATGITIPGLIAFVAFNITTIPCFAAVATAKAELRPKDFKYTILFWLAISYLTGIVVYVAGTWWWTTFIFLGLAILGIFAIHFINKVKDMKYAEKEKKL
jgi:ferrous iron transport protein B